jgi:plasmid stabilization system protein ParE
MRDLALEHARPSLILWYSYFDIARSSDPDRHWADLVAGAFAPLPARPDAVQSAPATPPAPTIAVPAQVHGAAARRKTLQRKLARCARQRSAGRRAACRAGARSRFRSGSLVRWRLAAGADRAELTVFRVARGRSVQVGKVTVAGRAGRLALDKLLPARHRSRTGSYVVRLRASHAAGFSAPAEARFRIVR